MFLFDKAVEETSGHIDHKMTVPSLKTAVAVPCPLYMCQPVNATFETPPILPPVLVLENTSSLQLTGSQVSIFTL